MRDNHNGLPELLGTSEQDGKYFGVVQLDRSGQQKRFRFGLSQAGYLSLTKILQLRPFDQMPGVPYRYFFVPSLKRLPDQRVEIAVRVEQAVNSGQIEVEIDHDLAANLMWFFKLEDWGKADSLALD